MNFEKAILDNRIEYSTDHGTVVFGFEKLDQILLQQAFPDLKFLKLHQVHSDKVVPAGSSSENADAHYTEDKGLAPLVQTADCLPVVTVGKNIILSIHAGWRGIEQNIIGKSLKYLSDRNHDFLGCMSFIGPHIAKESFEVELDVAQILEKAFVASGGNPECRPIVLPHSDLSKKYVDLESIARQQIAAIFPNMPVESTLLDTYKDHRFHSYRRNRTKGRQWSFGFLS